MTQTSETAAPADSGRKVAGDAAFSVAERIVSQFVQFAVFVVAARTLGPAEFGIFALVSACAILLLTVAELGWAPFIMSQSGDETVPRHVLFVAILNGTAFAALGCLAALVGGAFGLSEDIVLLMVLFAIWVALANAGSAQKGVLVWMGRLRAAAMCSILGEVVGLAVALAALFTGASVLALVYGRLSCQAINLVLGFCMSRKLPLPGVPAALLRELWVFSSQIFLSRILVQIRLHFVTLIIGAFLGPASVGFFRAAERLVGAVSELIVVPGQLLAWTQLRKARDSGGPEGRLDRLNAQVGRHLKVLIVVGAPLFLLLILMNEELVRGLLGEQWRPAASLVAILALGRLLLFLGILTEPLMSIVGQARRLPLFMASILAVSVVLTLVAVQFDVLVVAWSQVAISAIVMVATIVLFARHGGVRWGSVGRTLRATLLPLACGIVTIAWINHALAPWGMADLAEVVLFGMAGIVVYVAAIAVFDRVFWGQIAALVRPAPQVAP